MDIPLIEKFIKCVKEHPELFNQAHPHYKSNTTKTRIWNEVSKEMDQSSDALRTKWKGLKDGYMKYKRWVLYREVNCKTYQNWCWAPHLKFLDPYINPRTVRHCSKECADLHSNNTPVSHDNNLEDSLQSPSNNLSTVEHSTSTSETSVVEHQAKLEPLSATITPCTSPTGSVESLLDPMETSTSHNNTELLSFMENKRMTGIDSIDLLFMSYADTFRKFSVGTQSKLKIKMASIFALAELQENNLEESILSDP